MAETQILTQSEIDALLSAVESGQEVGTGFISGLRPADKPVPGACTASSAIPEAIPWAA